MTTRTKQAIEDSFIRLASSKPIDKITVREIVEDCQINRNSFYYHFEDLPDLVETVLQEGFERIAKECEDDSIREITLTAIRQVYQNRSLFQNIWSSKNRDVLELKMLQTLGRILKQAYIKECRQKWPDVSEYDASVMIDSYVWMTGGMLLDWFANGFYDGIEEKVSRLWDLREGTFDMMLERANRNPKHGAARGR